MSSGDIDDTLAPEGVLEDLRLRNQAFNQYLIEAFACVPIRTFFIPYGAGISADGDRVYISYDVQTTMNGVDCGSALVRHETVEWGLRKFCGIGIDYLSDPSGHRIANRCEADHVNALLGSEEGWELYTEILDLQILIDERTEFEDRPIPQDLAMYPYTDAMREKLVSAMSNARSMEEWNKNPGGRIDTEEYDDKMDKREVNYREGTTDTRCGLCTMFMPPHGCSAVKGVIFPQDLCDLFERVEDVSQDEVRSDAGTE